ncbi:hypothetical protein FB45DRAFT_871429 [Roridomyces roridus]|uniref:Zn(2)-C6 fungal-type domain-containing protein n=1 Tax=Roridomyces roridus TaxID=1738132 RepID=A0AAD7BGI4_9AGAR|nr:hypothetical protein FB45DRAFT_871429 [Roridomyces roridus]
MRPVLMANCDLQGVEIGVLKAAWSADTVSNFGNCTQKLATRAPWLLALSIELGQPHGRAQLLSTEASTRSNCPFPSPRSSKMHHGHHNHHDHPNHQQTYFPTRNPGNISSDGEEERRLFDDSSPPLQSHMFYSTFNMHGRDQLGSHFDQAHERAWNPEYAQMNYPSAPNEHYMSFENMGPENQYNNRFTHSGVAGFAPRPQGMYQPSPSPGGMNVNYPSGTGYGDTPGFDRFNTTPQQAPPRQRPSVPVGPGPSTSKPTLNLTLTFIEETPGSKPPQFLACYQCRMRKIACQRPPADAHDQRCLQCYKRKSVCEYPTKSNRGLYTREGQSSGEGGNSKKKHVLHIYSGGVAANDMVVRRIWRIGGNRDCYQTQEKHE